MEGIKNEFKLLSYQINTLVLKGIKSLNIDINEFLLLIYFMNVNNILDLNDIFDKTSLSEEEILASYSSLIQKGIIEIKMEKINGKVNELISLENLYNKLALNTPKKVIETDIYSKFESEFGRSLSPMEYETINMWLNKGIKEELIISALKEAVMNGVTNLRYIDKIVSDWSKKGVQKRKEEEFEELTDYDWLSDFDE